MTTATGNEPNLVLNPFSKYDVIAMEKSNNRWSKVWLVAALVTAVVFTALATGVILYTTLHLPTHLPTVSILVFAVGMPSSFNAFKRLWDKKEHYSQAAKIDKELILHRRAITRCEWTLKEQLRSCGITADLSNEEAIIPLFARENYFQHKKDNHLQEEKDLLAAKKKSFERVKFFKKASTSKLDDSQHNQLLAFEQRQQAAMSQITSAYFIHLMKNPYETRRLSEFFTNYSASGSQRMIAKATGDASWDLLIKTPQKKYTVDQVLNTKATKLAKEIFEGKTGFFSDIGIG